MPNFHGKILLSKYLTFAGEIVYNYSIMGNVFKKNKKRIQSPLPLLAHLNSHLRARS